MAGMTFQREPAAGSTQNSPLGEMPEQLSRYFSPDYFTAKQRFLTATERLGAQHQSVPIQAPSPTGDPLTIDVAVIGAAKPKSALIVSSGLHGVEGFFGSAVQIAFLERFAPYWQPPPGAALVMLHSLNPFGFAWKRRFNEDNVDLNRNFLLSDEVYAGAPPLSAAFRRVMMPIASPLRFDLWPARMAFLAIRHGVQAFWETLPGGQYDYPDWLFFGGRAPTQTAEILDWLMPQMLDEADHVVHLDFHTGLGRWTNCQLLLSESESGENCDWWKAHFGEERVTETAAAARSYAARGSLGPWLQARLPKCRYRYATAEFGTYSPGRVIRALAEELRWHTKLGNQSADHWARVRLTEIFAPRNETWRRKSVETGISLIRRAADVLWDSVRTASG